jgi:hypothetical protein
MLRAYAAFVAVCFLSVRANSAVIVPTISGFTSGEQRVLNSAIDYWEQLIADPLPLQIVFSKTSLPDDQSAVSSELVESPGGLPLKAQVQIDDRKGSVIGWFVDPTPDSNEEFLPGFTPYHMRGRLGTPAGENYDLLTVLNHELAHVFGFTTMYSRFNSHVTDADFGLREYHGNGVFAALTSASDGTHVNDGVHPNDLMTVFRSRGERVFPSHLDLSILSDAFGYNVGSPGGTPVPEPNTLLSFTTGLLVLLIATRNRRAH